MTTIDLAATREIPADPDAVWAVLADYHQDPAWRSGVVRMTASVEGPVGPGASTREELRLGGRTYVNEGVIDEVEPGRRLRWHTVAGADARGSRTVEPRPDGGCRVTLELHVTPHGAERLLAPVLGRMLGRNLRGDLDRLAELVAERSLR